MPTGITPLRGREDRLLGQGIENPHRCMGGKIGGEKAEMKKWFAARAYLKGTANGGVIGTTPIHTMMQRSGGRAQLAHDPAICAARTRVLGTGRKLQIAGREREVVK